MNDFTKEELEDLFDNTTVAINSYTGCDSGWKKENRALILKIQSLIDNYCEHTHIWNRLTMLSEKDYDFCEKCLSVRRMR